MNKETRAVARALQHITMFIILITVIVVLIHLITVSTGQVPPLRDREGKVLDGGIAEKRIVDINGREQVMIIRGSDPEKPVLLFIQGAPGLPSFVLNETHPTDLEHHFTVVWWDGKGSGLSFHEDVKNSLSLKQSIQDTMALSEYLADSFHKDRIYLMGHALGSAAGVRAALERPELYHAYIGMSQAAVSPGGTQYGTVVYEKLSEIFQERRETRSKERLESLAIKDENGDVRFEEEDWTELSELKTRAGTGIMREMKSTFRELLVPLARSRAYTFGEKIRLFRARTLVRGSSFYSEAPGADLLREDLEFQVPVYFLSGVHDLINPFSLTQELYEKINAPGKAFYPFSDSAASPLWEEPGAAVEILVEDVLGQSR